LITLLIDLAIIGTVLFCAWRGFKNGLIRGAFGIVSLLLAIFIANAAAEAYSDETTGIISPFVSGMIETAVLEMADDGLEYHALAHDHNIDEADFGVAYMALRYIGLPEAGAVHIAERSLEFEAFDMDRSFADVIANRLSGTLSYVAVFTIAFLLISIIFAVIGNLIGVVFALPGLRLVDMIAGSALGLVKGLIIVYSVALVLRYFGLVMLETIEGTTILRHIINNNPIADILGI